MPAQTDFRVGVSESLDIIEGAAAAGVVGIVAFVVIDATAKLPGDFFAGQPPAVITAVAIVTSALTFVGLVFNRIRSRHSL